MALLLACGMPDTRTRAEARGGTEEMLPVQWSAVASECGKPVGCSATRPLHRYMHDHREAVYGTIVMQHHSAPATATSAPKDSPSNTVPSCRISLHFLVGGPLLSSDQAGIAGVILCSTSKTVLCALLVLQLQTLRRHWLAARKSARGCLPHCKCCFPDLPLVVACLLQPPLQ